MSRRRYWAVTGVVVVMATLVVAPMVWAALVTPTKVVGGKGNQISPSATPGGGFLAFSSSRPGEPFLFYA